MKRLLCLLGRHAWEKHPRFAVLPVRRCSRCWRVEERLFLARRWSRCRHIDGRDESQLALWSAGRKAEQALNDEWRRSGDARAVW